MFGYHEVIEGGLNRVEVAFTDSSVDLGANQPISTLEHNLTRLAMATGAQPILMDQVHGHEVAVVTDAETIRQVDGLITGEPEIALVVRVADCVPVVLVSEDQRWIAAAHAGRRGVVSGVVPETLRRLRDLGANRISAWIGPHICGQCYEVPELMRAEVCRVTPTAYAQTRWGTPGLDLGAGVAEQLMAHDCLVNWVDGCTLEDRQFPSYRRDGAVSGRMAGVVWIKG